MNGLLRNISWRATKVWRRNADVFLVTLPIEALPAIIEPVLYLLAFGLGLGSLVHEVRYEGQVVPYIRFLAPGTTAVAILFWSYFETTYSSYIRMYYQKTFDAILATPLLVEDVILGEMLYAASRSVLASIIMLGVIASFGLVAWPSGLLVLPVAALAGLFFAGVGLVVTSLVKNISHFNVPMSLFILPMFTFGGTFFPVEVLPSWAQPIAWSLPLTHVSFLVRAATLGIASPALVASVAYLGIGALLFGILALHRMKKRLVP
ncbi:MAG TPA: ABC transporter permease [Candidatus Eisenbacteria bacterium]|nr:ABC transporter permease [Candidatus Eisenbacteria bacterium]